jgi:hypothetical protein
VKNEYEIDRIIRNLITGICVTTVVACFLMGYIVGRW